MKPKIEVATYCLIGAVCGIFGYDAFIGLHVDRRFILYGILRELSPGASRQTTEAVVTAHEARCLHRHVVEHGMVLRVDLGLAHSCCLTLSYSDEKLVSARIRSEDGPGSRFSDAPPDI